MEERKLSEELVTHLSKQVKMRSQDSVNGGMPGVSENGDGGEMVEVRLLALSYGRLCMS